MTLLREDIRLAVVNRLTGQTSAEDRVYNSRIMPAKKNFPQIFIWTLSESREGIYSTDPLVVRIKINLEIHAITRIEIEGDSGSVVDSLCDQIYCQMDRYLGGNALTAPHEDMIYAGTDIDHYNDGDALYAQAVMRYEVTALLSQAYSAPAFTLDNLDTIGGAIDMAEPNSLPIQGPDGQTDAVSLIDNLYGG